MSSRIEPVACSLSADRADGQLLEWSDLRAEMTEVERLPDGVRHLNDLQTDWPA